MNNEPNNKLIIEMAREFCRVRSGTSDGSNIFTSMPFEWVAAFTQHVLDKQWTRVEDGLPEKSDIFDVTVDYGFHDPHTDIADFINGIWYDLDGNEYTMPNILAWRERPQPYVQPEKEQLK